MTASQDLSRFSLPFEPDRPTVAHCAYCGDDVLDGHEAYWHTPYDVYTCGLWCAGEHAAENGRDLAEYEKRIAGEE